MQKIEAILLAAIVFMVPHYLIIGLIISPIVHL